MPIIADAKKAIQIQIDALEKLKTSIGKEFELAVSKIIQSKNKVVITGIGKSALIAQKISATFNSTGTPSMFIHATDALHGDIGAIHKNDIIILISKSGENQEIKSMLYVLKKMGNYCIGIVGNKTSFLAKNVDLVLDSSIQKEACPNDLAPTTSTTTQLVLGDALAVSLIIQRKFTKESFARFHPGGVLGKSLLLKVEDIAKKNTLPSVKQKESFQNIIISISKGRLGATCVLNNNLKVEGIITDGDIRRVFQNKIDLDLLKVTAKDIMTSNPKIIEYGSLALDAVKLMQTNKINQLIITQKGKFKGFIHIQDLLNEGFYIDTKHYEK